MAYVTYAKHAKTQPQHAQIGTESRGLVKKKEVERLPAVKTVDGQALLQTCYSHVLSLPLEHQSLRAGRHHRVGWTHEISEQVEKQRRGEWLAANQESGYTRSDATKAYKRGICHII